MLNSGSAIARENTQAEIGKATQDLLKKKYKVALLFPVNHTIANPITLQVTVPKHLNTVKTIKKGSFEATSYSKPAKRGWAENVLTHLSVGERNNAISLISACIKEQKNHEYFEILDAQDHASKSYLYSTRLFKIRVKGTQGVSLLVAASGPYDTILIQYAIPYHSAAELSEAMNKLKSFKQKLSVING